MKSALLASTLVCLIFTQTIVTTAQSPARRARRPVPISVNKVSPSGEEGITPAKKSIAQTLPLKRVILYSNGVAYFERRGTVRGRAEVELAFKQSQVDDVLKSMVVLDLGQGRIGTVSYNSSQPPQARLADIPFSIAPSAINSTTGGLAGVLRQLQGALISVTTAQRTMTGNILTVEQRMTQFESGKPSVTTHHLVIAAASGEVAEFDLNDVRSVKLLDEGTQRDIREFANASSSARRRDAKTIVVTSDGEGAREMLVSYTVAAPIWKTTYRAVLDSQGQPFFQGWAIVDNVSEEDWTNVQLSLVSGTPISFIQPIQQPFYRYRPIVPMPENLNLEPQTYEPETGEGMGRGRGASLDGSNEVTVTAAADVLNTTSSELSARQVDNLPMSGRRGEFALLAPSDAPAATSLSDAIINDDSVRATAKGEKVGDLFEYRIDQPVTIQRDRSALIPILQTRMIGERVSIYNEAVRSDRPLGGMLLKNTSALTLEGGSMTVIDGDAYAGEALMERLKPGEDRLISFALDLGTLVAARTEQDREPVFLIRATNGVLQAHYFRTEKKTYTLTNQTDRPRTIFIERPIRQGWELKTEPNAKIERTPQTYRLRVELQGKQTVTLPVVERQALMDSFALSNFTSENLQILVARRYIDDSTRAQLAQLIELKSRIAALDANAATLEQEANEIAADQNRLRENIKALGSNTEARALIARYVEKANTQETRLETLTQQRRRLAEERARLQSELDMMIRNFSVERKL